MAKLLGRRCFGRTTTVRSGEMPSYRGGHNNTSVASNGRSYTPTGVFPRHHAPPSASSDQKRRSRWLGGIRRRVHALGTSPFAAWTLIFCGMACLTYSVTSVSEATPCLPGSPRVVLLNEGPWIVVSSVVAPRLRPTARKVSMEMRLHFLPDEAYYINAATKEDNYTSNCPLVAEWSSVAPPTCNLQHELAFALATNSSTSQDNRMEHIGSGAVKDVWRVVGQQVVLKTTAYKHPFVERYLHKSRRDALVMEATTASHYVLNIHSYCAYSSVIEAAHGTVRHWLDESIGSNNGSRAHKNSNPHPPPPVTMLRAATQMAEGLRDVHLFTQSGLPTFAHADIKLSQFLIVSQPTDSDHPRIKLNDFNRGRFLSAYNNQLCPFYITSRHVGSKNRAPEEYVDRGPQTDKIDVFALGSTFYEMLTGHAPFHEMKDYKEAMHKIVSGVQPAMPTYLRNSTDPSLQAIIKAMTDCRIYRAEHRPDSRVIADFLQGALRQAERGSKT